jgi:hypothetical protein
VSEQETYFLSRDVYSFVKRGRLYGKMGDPVTVIKRSDHVLIVQLKSGDRFSVLQEDISTSDRIAPVPIEQIKQTAFQKPRGRTRQKASSQIQSLF